MKMKLLLSLFLMLSSLVQAQDCLQSVCVGDTVIDESNTIGRVTSIKDGVVKYQTSYSSYEATSSRLSRQIQSNRFPIGKKVIDSSNTVGTVALAFENGKVQYKTSYSSYIASDLSPEVSEVDGVKLNDTVIDGSNTIGTVTALFENGKKQYKTSYSSYISRELSPEIPELGSLRSGVNVIDESNTTATVTKVFANGKVSYKTSYSSYVQNASSLSAETISNSGIQPGKRIIDSSNTIGEVLAVYENGKVRYKTSYSSYISKDVSPEVEEVRGISRGQVVLADSSTVLKVDGVFQNGKVSGRSSYSSSIVSADSVSKESETHAQYSKDELYADNSGNVGKITRFFENGSVQIGSQVTNQKLSSEVSDYLGVQKDSDVVSSAFVPAKVSKIFENGVLVTEKSGNLIYKTIEDLNENLRLHLLREIGWSRNGTILSARYAFNKEEVPAIKKLLLETLTAKKDAFSKEDIKYIQEFLGGKISEETPVTPSAQDLSTKALQVNVADPEMRKIVEDTIEANDLSCPTQDGMPIVAVLDVDVVSTNRQCKITMTLTKKIGFSEMKKTMLENKQNLLGSLRPYCKNKVKTMTLEIFQ